jgi:hypothetical protein
MFKLSEVEISEAIAALEFHGLSAFFPPAPEWQAIRANADVKAHIQNLDLDTYAPYQCSTSYLKKDTRMLRAIENLHPQDTIILTALVHLLRDAIEAARLPPKMKKSFSYRAPTERGALYQTRGNYEKYRARTEQRLSLTSTKFVATADISNFFANVYQHRLQNAILSAARNEREREATRVLSKLLSKLAGGKSYGIPTGPYASRVLAEAVLIDVDAALQEHKVDFVRWMDDITIFTKSEEEGSQVIQFLAAWLRDHHGLSLNESKTKIYPKAKFITDIWKTYDDEHEQFRQLVKRMKSVDPYDEGEFDIDEEDDDGDEGESEIGPDASDEDDEQPIEDKEIVTIFDLAMTIETAPKYGLIKHILERVIFRDGFSQPQRLQIIRRAMAAFEKLEPVFDAVAKSVAREFDIPAVEVEKFCKKVLSNLQARKFFTPGHTLMWACWLVGERACKNLKVDVKDIYNHSQDSAVRREALIALSKVGSRPDVLSIKDKLAGSPDNERTALILASKALGADERKYWRQSNAITDIYEKAAFDL